MICYSTTGPRTPDGKFDLRYRYTVCGLKKDKADLNDLYQLLNYSQAVGNNLAERDFHLAQPILIAYDFEEQVKKAIELGFTNHKKHYWLNITTQKTQGLP